MSHLPFNSRSFSINSDSRSSFSANLTKSAEYTYKKTKWRSNWQFIMSMLCYVISSESYKFILRTGTSNEPNIVQYLMCYCFIGMPIMYMQIVLGQYTQMGIFYFKYCIPAAKGIAHTYLISVLLQTVKSGYVMTDKLVYFLLTFRRALPWNQCPEEYKDVCFTNKASYANITDKNNSYHAAYIYWRYVYMANPEIALEAISRYDMPNTPRIVALLATWGLTFSILYVFYDRHRKVIRALFYMYAFGLLVMFFSMLFKDGAVVGLSTMLGIQVHEFYNLDTWMAAIRMTISRLVLAELYHTYAGAHLTTTAQSGVISVGCVFLIFLVDVIASGITGMCDSFATRWTNISSIMHKHDIPYYAATFFVVIPQGLVYLVIPQMWCAIYFGTNMLLAICNQTLHLITMQMAITDMYPNFYKYRLYVLGVICIFSASFCLCLLPDCIYALAQIFFRDTIVNISCICVLVLCIAVFWVYGVTNLSDDIHFMMGSQPSIFWKVCWYLCPAFLAMNMAHVSAIALQRSNTYIFVTAGTTLFFISPIGIYFITEVLSYIRKRNLIGAICPTELWGPPDPEERILRYKFNPRLATRFEAHKMVCEHSCLFGNKTLKTTYNQENSLRREYLIYLMKTRGLKINIVEDL